jgi:hypothetical protein
MQKLETPKFKNITAHCPEIVIFSEYDSALFLVQDGIRWATPPTNKNSTMRFIKMNGEIVHVLDRVSGQVLHNDPAKMSIVRSVIKSFENLS